MLSLKHAAPIRELSISALGLCLGLLMPGCTNDPVTSGLSSTLAGRAASSAAGTGAPPSSPLTGTGSLPETSITPGQTSSTGAPVASGGAAGMTVSEGASSADSGTAVSAADAGGSAGGNAGAASDAGVAGAPSAAGSGAPTAGSAGSAGAGGTGVMCENLACFDIFDCALYHLAEFGPCGFTKCDGFICKP